MSTGITIGDYILVEEIKDENYDFDWDVSMSLKQDILRRQYSTTYKGYQKNTKQKVIIKKINLEQIQKNKGLQQELQNMKDFKSNNYIKIYDIYNLENKVPPQLYIIEEQCPISLNQYIYVQNKGNIPENKAIQIIRNIVSGVEDFINFQQQRAMQIFQQQADTEIVVYESLLDLQPSNIFITEDGVAKVSSNFGLQSALFKDIKKHLDGRPIYKAPQVVMNELGFENVQFSFKSDIWSLGIVCYQILFGKMPWVAREQQSYLKQFSQYGLKFPYEKQIGINTRNFIIGCLEFDEENRFNWFDVFSHPLIKEGPGELYEEKKFFLNASGIKIMEDIQKIIELRDIDIKIFLQEQDINGDNQLDKKEFYYMINQLDPRITYYESQVMFEQISRYDKIVIQDFLELLQNYDFTNLEDKKGILLQEIKEIIKIKEIQMEQLFGQEESNSILNKSTLMKSQIQKTQEKFVSQYFTQSNQSLNKEQFKNLIGFIAPGLRNFEFQMIFDKLDINRDQRISKNEIITQFLHGFNNQSLIDDKVKKLIYGQYFQKNKEEQISLDKLKELFEVYDRNEDGTLSFQEFVMFMHDINNNLPIKDIQAIFEYIDQNNSGEIDIKEFFKLIERKVV